MIRATRLWVIHYVNIKGVSPFRNWITSLKDHRAKAKIASRIERVIQGNTGDKKYIGDGIYELRIHLSPGYRIYFGMDGQATIVLLYGGIKGSQKKDIKLAKKYWANYTFLKYRC